jgi:hypothetical protein
MAGAEVPSRGKDEELTNCHGWRQHHDELANGLASNLLTRQ